MLAYQPRSRSSVSRPTLALVAGLHVGALALALLAQPQLVEQLRNRTEVIFIDPDPVVPPPPPPPEPVETPTPPMPRSPSVTLPDPVVETPTLPGPAAPRFVDPAPVIDPVPAPQVGPSTPPAPSLTPIAPVLVGATLLTSGPDLQPPYPSSAIRNGEEAVLRLRLAIDAHGRVTAVTPVGRADPAFVRAAERHLKRVWRYAPASRDGTAVASTETITLRFVLE